MEQLFIIAFIVVFWLQWRANEKKHRRPGWSFEKPEGINWMGEWNEYHGCWEYKDLGEWGRRNSDWRKQCL